MICKGPVTERRWLPVRCTDHGFVLRAGSATSWEELVALDPYTAVPMLLCSPDETQLAVSGPLPPALLLGLNLDNATGEASSAARVGALSKEQLSKRSKLKPERFVQPTTQDSCTSRASPTMARRWPLLPRRERTWSSARLVPTEGGGRRCTSPRRLAD